jgi:cell division septum initiation protein DivIVA
MVDERERLETIGRLMDELEGFAQKSSFLLPHKILIPDQEFFRICMELREMIPAVLKEAQEIVGERDNIIENAKREHRRILQTAEDRMRDMVSDEAVVREAQYEAERLIGNARTQAEELRRESLIYTDENLAKIGDSFSQVLESVNNGRKLIKRLIEDGQPGGETQA